MKPSYSGHRFPLEIVSYAVWPYHRFTLSFRDVKDLLAERGISLSYDAIRFWCLNFGPQALAIEVLSGIATNKLEIRIGKTKLLFLLNRFMPKLAEKIIRHS